MTKAMVDKVTVITWSLILVSMVIFYFFGKFTVKLIRQYQDISSLIYEFEEREKEGNQSRMPHAR